MWVEKAIDIANNQQSETSPKSTKSSNKNNAAYKANCLTPRSCPKFIHAGTSQQQTNQQQGHSVEYKSEDEMWVEKAYRYCK
ncbi:hypothetical protein PVAND_000941 [Polypedilum vanderplanki]|uniref:Uncharacterized protein n=1 Tax=Polypedilum vanderplanki TaxID=319348 RepID=A0A9J6BMQ9_POLVA|nr:hypothetical protein PVAND_000941 [Polypedilum vanderplanki]